MFTSWDFILVAHPAHHRYKIDIHKARIKKIPLWLENVKHSLSGKYDVLH